MITAMTCLDTNLPDLPLALSPLEPVVSKKRDADYLPSKSDISRVADKYFPKQQSCLDTPLLEEKDKEEIRKQSLTIRQIKNLIDNDKIKDFFAGIKSFAKGKGAQMIEDYSILDPINKASLVVFPERKYLLSILPNTEREFQWFWKNVVDFNIRKVVAAVMYDEDNEKHQHVLRYCKPKFYPLKVDDKWTIELKETTILAKSTAIDGCEIVKRVFKLSSNEEERQIEHYHYQGWKDNQGAPDANLLARVIEELDVNSQETVAIHCSRGRGRSANVVLADLFKKRINASAALYPSKDDIPLNLTETLMQGRFMRDGFVIVPQQIVSALDSAGVFAT